MKKEDIKFALEHSSDYGRYPDVFPLDFGMDFHLETEPELYPKIDVPRKVKIKISDFIGTCPWAVHYYADIHAEGIQIKKDTVLEDGSIRTYTFAGYICEEYANLSHEDKSKWNGDYHITVTREITAAEIYEDPQTWEGYEAGEMTYRFGTPKDAIDMAMKVAKARFPGWKIEIEKH